MNAPADLIPVVVRAAHSQVKRADDAYMTFVVEVPREHTLEQALHPRYVGGSPKVLKEARPGSIILLRAVDHRFQAELYVEAIDREAEALVYRVLRVTDLKAAERLAFDWVEGVTYPPDGDNFSVALDGKIIRRDFSSKAQAEAWVRAKTATG